MFGCCFRSFRDYSHQNRINETTLAIKFRSAFTIPPRIVLYRMPLQSHARNRMDLQFAIRDEVVSRLAEIYGRRPEEIDPDWGM